MALILRVCGPDGESYNGFKWPLGVGVRGGQMIRYILPLLLVGCSMLPEISWTPDNMTPSRYYVWVTTPKAREYCRHPNEPHISCAPVRLTGVGSIVPPEARDMDTDEVIGRTITNQPVCFIYSTESWATAAWARSGYNGDGLSHLEHEKKHCRGFGHQPLDYLLGREAK